MGSEKEFYSRDIDRTAYSSCIGVALVVVVFFCSGSWIIWKTADYLRKNPPDFPRFSLPKKSPSPGTLRSIRDQAQQQLDQIKEQAQKSAEAELEKQKEAQKKELEKNIDDKLNNFLQP